MPAISLARDADSVGQWLASYIFEGNGATLVLCGDGFFGLRLNMDKKRHRDFTGRWRLSSDGIELTLYNNQDAEIKLTVGEIALHAILPALGDVTLIPVEKTHTSFQIVGPLERRGKEVSIVDAASGKKFQVSASDAQDGKFATAEVEIGPHGARSGKIMRHSGSVPRFFHLPAASASPDSFAKGVVGRFWLLPPMKGADKAALRFNAPADPQKPANGNFEIAGPGVRLEGQYQLAGNKLTLQATRANIQNLVLSGAGEIANIFLGELTWRLSPSGLEFQGKKRVVLLPADS